MNLNISDTGRLDELFDHTGLLAEELNWMEAALGRASDRLLFDLRFGLFWVCCFFKVHRGQFVHIPDAGSHLHNI